MFDALYIAATGMQAQQLNLDTIANNLANVNTTGFKKGRVAFSDLVDRHIAQPLANAAEAVSGPLNGSTRMGAGVTISGLTKLFDAGSIKKTESAFDLAIQGDGFIELSMPDGSRAYTRGGTMKVNQDGFLSTQSGYALKPGIAVPDNAQSITIRSDGRVRLTVAGQTNPTEAGQLELVRFTSPGGLRAQGDNLYRSTENSGEAITARPGENGVGAVAQGFLEGSNVQMVEEMVNLMVAQRAYEASVKVVQAADEVLGMINGLRK